MRSGACLPSSGEGFQQVTQRDIRAFHVQTPIDVIKHFGLHQQRRSLLSRKKTTSRARETAHVQSTGPFTKSQAEMSETGSWRQHNAKSTLWYRFHHQVLHSSCVWFYCQSFTTPHTNAIGDSMVKHCIHNAKRSCKRNGTVQDKNRIEHDDPKRTLVRDAGEPRPYHGDA